MVRAFCALLCLTLVACGDDEPIPAPALCSSEQAQNRLEPSPWAQSLAGLGPVSYAASRQEPRTTVRADSGASLEVHQAEDGRLLGEAEGFTIESRGYRVSDRGYGVRFVVGDGGDELEIRAEFDVRTCAAPPPPDRLPCAPGLDPARVPLPGCGLVYPLYVRDGLRPQLRRLSLAVPADGDVRPPGGAAVLGDAPEAVFEVREGDRSASPETLDAWLDAVGWSERLRSERFRAAAALWGDLAWQRDRALALDLCEARDQGLPTDDLVATGKCKASRRAGWARKQACGVRGSDLDPDGWGGGSPAPGSGGGNNLWGDPHVTSLDGNKFDFQGAGEYWLSRAPDLRIQGRFQPFASVRDDVAACRDVTVTTAVAADFDGRVVEARLRPRFGVFVDGQAFEDSGFEPSVGSTLLAGPGSMALTWPDGTELEVDASGRALKVYLRPAADRAGRLQGLLGNFDGDPTNDAGLPDGRWLDAPLSFSERHRVWGEAWRTTRADSLFVRDPGSTWSDFQDPAIPLRAVSLDDVDPEEAEAARQACQAGAALAPSVLQDCVLDTLCDPENGDAYADDARDAAPPRFEQDAEGRVAVEGDVRLAERPAPLPSPEVCAPVRDDVLLVPEARTATLAFEVMVDAAGPGPVEAGGMRPPPLGAGLQVDTYAIVRPRAGPPRAGVVRFARPVLGIRFDVEAGPGGPPLPRPDGTTPHAPAPGTWSLSADRRELQLRDGGDAPFAVRVFTEVFE